ncbi:SPOR domain-containing protein [bacterium]|nr:MAG: SPOR domain-containing protein [bacterium]
MVKDAHPQLELFSSINTPLNRDPQMSRNFFSYLKRYEKIVLLTIGFIIFGIVSFCLGVEKGKGNIRQAYQYRAVASNPPQEAPVQPALRVAPKQEVVIPVVLKASGGQKYTIQLVTFQSSRLAQKEVEALRKKGLKPLAIPKGSYVIVCVGSFSSKDTARSLLPDLKKRYQDCFIRRL